ncbi:MAG: SGNH/GDSL hydrolase family protein [Mycobacteriaceae bacterium]
MSSFSRFVALGDSFTEGVGDNDLQRPNGLRGWADRVAEVLSERNPNFQYANLAVRGRLLGQVVDEQLIPALELKPDLVTVYAGGNDLLRPKVDFASLMDSYSQLIQKFTTTGSTVLIWTASDPVNALVFGKLRGRFAIYNELVRELADLHGAKIVDFWRMRDYQDARMWDFDRLHMSAAGHIRMAEEVLSVLGVATDLNSRAFVSEGAEKPASSRKEDLLWAKEFLLPWIGRRVRGVSSGDEIAPRYPQLMSLTSNK